MWIITFISLWIMFNATVVINHIKKLTEDNNRPSFTPYFSAKIFTLIFVFGVIMYLFLKKIRKIRYIRYLEQRLELLNFGNYEDRHTKEIEQINRQLKLNKLQKKSKRFKIWESG